MQSLDVTDLPVSLNPIGGRRPARKGRHLLPIALAAACVASSASAATVVDFAELAHDNPVRIQTSWVSGGFSFNHSGGGSGASVWGRSHSGNADRGGATLGNWGGGQIKIARTNGEMFSLLSLDIADLGNQGVDSPALFTFFDGVRTTSRLINLDNARGLQTLTFGQAVQWFSFATPTSTGGSGTFQIDNLTWSAAGAVPEPASWAMMIMGFLGAGAAIRARRRTTLMPA